MLVTLTRVLGQISYLGRRWGRRHYKRLGYCPYLSKWDLFLNHLPYVSRDVPGSDRRIETDGGNT